MYKVLIADDEELIRKGLGNMVSLHSKLQVVALAEDGEIALEKAKDIQPDLMLVDINMPFLSGLDLIEEIRKILPDVIIVIVTGYDDFEFVRKALQLGVTDYVLKPVMEEDFFEVLNKAVERLENMNQSKKFYHWIEEQIEQNRPIMINEFFHNWLSGELDEAEIEEQMQYLKIRMPVPYYITIMHFHIDYEREALPYSGDREEEFLYFGCCNIVEELFKPYSEVIFFRTEGGELVVISKVIPFRQWEQLMQEIQSAMEERLYAKMEIVKEEGTSVADFPESFKNAFEDYKNRKHFSDIILQVISIINVQWRDSEFSLQYVADSLHISVSYLSRLFRKETGENFAVYLTRKRIHEAKNLLKNTNMKMYEIAQRTGYTSQHYFSSNFKKVLGISPADYRKNILNKGE